MRQWRYGDPLVEKGTVKGEPETFLQDVVLQYNGVDCLIWPYSRSLYGYGQIWLDGRLQTVSRVACKHLHGPPPTSEHHAAHTCGRGHQGCVNPNHLRWATCKENLADRKAHGTMNYGERNGASKLTEADVRTIRKAQGFHREIAAKFGVSRETIGEIKRGVTWKNLT